MQKSIFLFILITFISLSACSTEPEFQQISRQQMLQNTAAGKSQIILDVRSVEEFAEGHIPGAINISYEQIDSKLTKLDMLTNNKDLPLVVYCRSGRRAGIALDTLQKNGFTKIQHLEGDMNGWQSAKLPINK